MHAVWYEKIVRLSKSMKDGMRDRGERRWRERGDTEITSVSALSLNIIINHGEKADITPLYWPIYCTLCECAPLLLGTWPHDDKPWAVLLEKIWFYIKNLESQTNLFWLMGLIWGLGVANALIASTCKYTHSCLVMEKDIQVRGWRVQKICQHLAFFFSEEELRPSVTG